VNELLARIRAAMRRAAASSPGADAAVLKVGPLRIDQARREVTVGDRDVRLTTIEYRLLVLLAGNAGKVLTNRQILKEVQGPPYVNESHYLRVFMATLRRKVEEDPVRPRLLLTEPGAGYRMRDT
jgi:two-component system KDP operon response regulator KdpE